MTGYLTTHVLDTSLGRPAAGLKVELFRLEAEERLLLNHVATNADGRTDGPILPGDRFQTGTYEILFHAGDYLRASGASDAFLDLIPLRFRMMHADHYHVPLLLSPFSFSTYRGS